MNIRKVLLCGLLEDYNIGDKIIVESSLFLLKNIYPEFEYEMVDMHTRDRNKKRYVINGKKYLSSKIWLFGGKVLKRICEIIDNKQAARVQYYFWERSKLGKKSIMAFFDNKVKNADLIIFAGGGIIECKHYDCFISIDVITTLANKYNKSVIFSGVGFNGNFISGDYGYERLQECLNRSSVKKITVRENLPEMNMNYLKFSTNKASLICDPAVWSAECYNILHAGVEKHIGVNVIRASVFKEFGYNYSEKELVNLYFDIIKKLEEKKYSWQIFTNGVEADYQLGLKVLNKLGLSYKENILDKALTGRQFLKQLSSFEAIISARMHASICSYSLKIPSIVLSWNEKLEHFYSNIGYPERCLIIKDFEANKVVFALEKAIKDRYEEKKYFDFRYSIIKEMSNFLLI